jgi:two-component system NtrC family response regulator
MKRVLLIDDDMNLAKVIGYQLQKNGFEVVTSNDGRDGLRLFNEQEFDIVITDIQMPGVTGIELLGKIRRQDKVVVVIIITAYGSIENAIEACRLGADDYLTKPFGQEQLIFVIEKVFRLRQLQQENTQLRQQLQGKYRFENMIAHSSKMENVMQLAGQVAQSNATVLILGESGTGKELIAQAIHFNSPRKDKPFVIVNCPSIPDNLLESELFGHLKGAYTGAIKDRKGKFELANGGTIFLDEIGDLKEDVQAKLLRVLQEREIERLGDSHPIKVQVRVVAATNKDLDKLVRKGNFREDLYYRLSVVPMTIPPLRERKEDIPYLVEFFIQKYGEGRTFEVDPEIFPVLQNYDWPGNVRELENVIERAIALSADDTISAESLPSQLFATHKQPGEIGLNISDGDLSLEKFEKRLIQEALNKSGGNRSGAARLLKIPRHVLLYRLKKYRMD